MRAAACAAAPGAAAARPWRPAAVRPAAVGGRQRRLAVAAAAAGSGQEPAWQGSLKRSASQAQAKFEEWAREQRLQERLQGGMQAAERAAKEAAKEVEKTARKVDSEYDVSGKAADAAKRAAEAARKVNSAAEDADSKWGVRRRLRYFFTDLKRKAPLFGRQVQAFLNTPMGAVTFLFLFLISVFTGAFWVILRVLFSLMWLGILLGPLLINYLQVKAVREQQEQYREYMAEQQRRQQSPFYGTPFEDLFSGPKKPGPGRFGGGQRRPVSSDDVIDVSFERLDD